MKYLYWLLGCMALLMLLCAPAVGQDDYEAEAEEGDPADPGMTLTDEGLDEPVAESGIGPDGEEEELPEVEDPLMLYQSGDEAHSAPEDGVADVYGDADGQVPPDLPRPVDVEVMDLPNDDGSSLALMWNWEGAASPNIAVTLEVKIAGEVLEDKRFTVTENDLERYNQAYDVIKQQYQEIKEDWQRWTEEAEELNEALQVAEATESGDAAEIRSSYWDAKNKATYYQERYERRWDLFRSKIKLDRRRDVYNVLETRRFINATLDNSPWVTTNVAGFEPPAGKWQRKAEKGTRYFGHGARDEGGNKVFMIISEYNVLNPKVINGTYDPDERNEIGQKTGKSKSISLQSGKVYEVRLRVDRLDEEGNVVESAVYPLGGAELKTSYFNTTKLNNFIFAVGFAIIILVAIMLAKRNQNMFIRRISGLEAVDNAIGRATEMGRPVLYLNGLDTLATLSTLAAINILGRVARKIADYDSDLIVPNRDPVVLTVAQEVVREGYIDQGRPDAYKEDNIFFVTDDQFSFTATTCAIMMRDKPAANFFMGYYYAESLLLAETGAATGAIQIAGTDALHQLPFFITTCDYTLIGEELYAASAYLSREPKLLGSLKGQDLAKGLVMLLIIIQTLLFLFSSEWSWLRMLVEPL